MSLTVTAPPGGAPRALAVVPARLGSTRFPEKVLADRTGRPLVQHVVERARQAKLISDVVVATDSGRVADALRSFGTRCVMTDPRHPSGTDRIAEVVAERADVDLVVNVQGDEPEIDPDHLDRLVTLLAGVPAPMATLVAPFPTDADPLDPNRVKAVVTHAGPFPRALYFSRAAVPFDRDGIGVSRYLHVGVYAYRREFLLNLTRLTPTPLELAERLEQLRVLEHGYAIAVAEVPTTGHGIDTSEQYEAFVQRHAAQRVEGAERAGQATAPSPQ